MFNIKKLSAPKIIITALFLILITVVFRTWFSTSILSSGDWIYIFKQAVSEGELFSTWDSRFSGMGQSQIPTMWIHSYFTLTLKTVSFIPWQLFERLFWFFPFLVVSFLSSLYLARRIRVLGDFSLLVPVIFIFNTYSLLVIGGGQVGIALSYALAPLILGVVLKNIELVKENLNIRIIYAVLTGITFSLQILIDPRLFYVTFIAVMLLFIFNIFIKKINISILNICLFLIFPFGLVFLLHSFWLIPILIVRENPFNDLSSAYSSIDMVRFLSFAKLENSLSMLHPNWPENIFGKVNFQKPEFLAFPILAYASLLFVKKNEAIIIFFVILSLVGVFLGKGANEPLGDIYILLFDNFPGFRLFRDPTKWYLLITLSYSVLIPYSVYKIYELLRGNKNKYLKIYAGKIFLLVLAITFFISITPILTQYNRGTYKARSLPGEYIELASRLSSDDNFYRTLWIPLRHRFGYNSEIHPAVSAELFFNTSDRKKLLNSIKSEDSRQKMIESSIRYIVLPLDTDEEFFLDDRKYSEEEYRNTVSEVEKIPWLVGKESYGKVVLFDIGESKPKFWCDCEAEISFTKISNTRYLVNVKSANSKDVMVFSEKFSRNWEFRVNGGKVNSINYRNLNSFELPEGDSNIEVYYSPHKYFELGLKITIITMLVIFTASILLLAKKIRK